MNSKYYIAQTVKIDSRKKLAEEFYIKILDPEEVPYLVTDDASLYDIYAGDENELIEKIKKEYGIILTKKHFRIAFWQLLDFLNEENDCVALFNGHF